MTTVKIRFNTEHNGTDRKWRILVDGEEKLAKHVCISKWPVITTEDHLPDGRVKHHITVEAEQIIWSQGNCYIQ